MAYITKQNYQEYSVRCTYELKSGTIPKDHLSNHGEKFTGPLEKHAVERAKDYLGSCGRFLTNCRVSLMKGNDYYGC